ncbi:SDR family NAD(P)-dependent oxidoreductase [Nonlabens spongiae]|nr:SDR family oxidoreductase [Nonlabens spongiae]
MKSLSNNMQLKNKTALITGSSRGVGQQIALGLAGEGCDIIVHARNIDHCQEMLEKLKSYDVKTYSVAGDLSQESGVKHLIEQVDNLSVPVDILYNNAGIMVAYKEDIWSHTTEDFMQSYQVNVVAPYKLCAAFVPAMIDRGYGRVVNLTSRIDGIPELAPYGATKWAIDKLSMDLATKLQDTNVRLNYLDPTWLKTDMGGDQALNEVEAVLPGALEPVLIDNDGPNGQFFQALKN